MSADARAADVVERFYAAMEADDVERMLALCADDVEVRYPAAGKLSYGGEWRGRDGIGDFLDTHEEAEEILAFEPASMIADGDTVVVLGDFRGRARASGREWSTRFVHVMTVTDAKLRRWESFFDTSAALDAR